MGQVTAQFVHSLDIRHCLVIGKNKAIKAEKQTKMVPIILEELNMTVSVCHL